MDSFEWNKVAGAVLSALLVIMGIREAVSLVYAPHLPEDRAYAIEVPEIQVAAVEEDVVSLAELLAGGDVAKGERVFARCKSCHTVESGGGNRVGPNLYNVIGAALATREGFNYSGAMQGAGGVWDYESMDAWLAKPKEFIPGNKMAYAGLRKPVDRANIILYLRQYADAAPALPAFEAPLPEADIAPSDVDIIEPAAIEAAEETALDAASPAVEAEAPAENKVESGAEAVVDGEASEDEGAGEGSD